MGQIIRALPIGSCDYWAMQHEATDAFEYKHTERLDLCAVSMADLAALFAINSDPETWRHDPDGRHITADQTRVWIDRAAARWRTDGLSYWSVRLRSDGSTIGVGGVQRHASGGWNLYYRFAPSSWGHGYATEMSQAALAAAAAVDPEVPVFAWIVGHNEASRAVAERLGLKNYGEFVDTNDGVTRLAYADRQPFGPASAVLDGDAEGESESRRQLH
jgi:RimJ/RimL family protein N-acetyltransferase